MMALIEAAVQRTRTVIIAFLVVVLAGVASYRTMPKENEPDIAFPFVNVQVVLEGVAPEDSERLLVRPLEQELRTLAGLKEMVASAAEGRASISLEFEPEVDVKVALQEVRERVDLAKAKLPQGAEEPRVDEIKFSRFDPMLVLTLGGPVPERTLLAVSKALKDRLEGVAGVLEANVVGAREEVLEIIVNPLAMESYGLSPTDILNFVQRNNQLVAAGAMQGEQGRFAVKVPGVIESPEDILSLPIKVQGERVVHFEDIATVRRTFKDVESYARLNGEPSLAVEVVQRSGTNMLDTVKDVRAAIDVASQAWPPGVTLNYTRDKSLWVKKNLTNLVNNVAAAIVLVFIVLIGVLGFQNALLVGIPSVSSNTTESQRWEAAMGQRVGVRAPGCNPYDPGRSDRKMAEGVHRRYAYTEAAKRMAWPIIASTATTLAAFLPLLFWPGLVGNFMVFFPVTLICILSASLIMALVVVPSMGSVIGRPGHFNEQIRRNLLAAETGDLDTIGGLTGRYIRMMERAMRRPWAVVGLITLLLFTLYAAYGAFGRGITMWPEVEPNQGAVDIRAIGDLSTQEKDRLVRRVEERVYGIDGVDNIYVRTGKGNQGSAPDQIGSIRLNFSDWRTRRPAADIVADIRERTADIAGLRIETRLPEEGPEQGKPIDIELSGTDRDALTDTARRLRAEIASYDGVVNAEDTSPLPGIEWRLVVDRAEAAKFGADVQLVGSVIQLVTTGIRLGDYRPDDSDEEIDIRVRFPELDRSLDRLGELRVPTQMGNIPISTFVTREPANATRNIMRTDGRRTLLVQADIKSGAQLDMITNRLKDRLPELGLDPSVQLRFKGGARDQAETQAFLLKAFALAMGLMAMILVTQFNSVFQALLILTAVGFSTGGVLLGLLVTGQAFSLVNCGIGAIALAGIVVNNNIVLIDTYNKIRETGMAAREAIIRTCAQRLRPVMLTTITTVLGLLPMALAINIDFLNREVFIGGPGMQWWQQMASAITGGLVFATLLTLLLTPALLMIQARISHHVMARRRRSGGNMPVPPAPAP